MKNRKTTGERILAYLAEHPDARDTAKGIAEWWLMSQATPKAVAEVEAALRHLVSQGKMSVKYGSDGSAVFGANFQTDGE
ncbi:MAG TPA: hypothetical protein VGO67_23165 [Verrucomicrobiae bacterium]